jgi:DNA-directed RNA polymerase specialized sigma24 family protein
MADEPQHDASDAQGAWNLSQSAWDHLLAFLDSDRERAGRAYERARVRLIKLFEWRGSTRPDELADETLNRVARKLEEGERIDAADPYTYFTGVARLVFLEHLRHRRRERLALAKPQPLPLPAAERAERDRRLDCLERAVASLHERSRRIIVGYYQGEKREKIENRKRLAEELAIPLNALRIRAHRIRARLEARVAECLEARRLN